MSRAVFLMVAACIAVIVGSIAIYFPAELLASKGAVPSVAANLWVREVGVLLVAIGVMVWQMKNHCDSATMKAFLFGNMLIQIGLLATEIFGYADGVVTKLSGIAPNWVLHALLASGFYFYGSRVGSSEPRSR